MTMRLRKRSIIAFAVVAALVAAALLLLFYESNKIVKAEVEKALGKGARIEKLSLGWHGVKAVGIHFSQGGQDFFSAKGAEVRAGIFGLFRKELVISEITIEQPSLILRTDASGGFANPLANGKEKKGGDNKRTEPPRPIRIGALRISDGALTIHGAQTSASASNLLSGTNEITGLQVAVDNLAFPLKNETSKVSLSMKVKGALAEGSAKCTGAIDPTTRAGSLVIEVTDVKAFRDDRGPRYKAASLRFAASSTGASPSGVQPIVLSDVKLDRPFLRIEDKPSGRAINPASSQPSAPGEKKPPVSFTLNKISVSGGEVLFLDGKIAHPPYSIRLTDIALTGDSCSFPAGNAWTAWRVSADIPGKTSTGRLSGAGRTNFQTFDTTGKASLRDLDILTLRPYLQQKGGAVVAGGTLDMDMEAAIHSKSINAPTHAVLKNLRFESGNGLGDRFLGVPRSLVVKLLESSKNELPLDFVVEGRLDNPQFSLREHFMRRISVGLGEKLGLGAIQTGEQAVKQGGRVFKGIGEGFRHLFIK